MTPASAAANGQLPGSRDKSPSLSNQSAGNDELQPEEPHITYVELPVTISRAISPDISSLNDRKEFRVHVPLPAQVEFPSSQVDQSTLVKAKAVTV